MRMLKSYAHIRGFNYQPSYASHGLEIWGDKFDASVIDREIGRGKEYFPNINTLRIWLSHDAFIKDGQRFVHHVGQALDVIGRYDLQAVVVLFNGWHSYPDFGGISLEQIGHFAGERFGLFADYIRAVVGGHAGDDRVLLWDLCNEPYNNARSEPAVQAVTNWLGRVHQVCRECDADTPLCVGACPHLGQIRTVEPISDVITFHPYFAWNCWIKSPSEVTDFLDDVVAFAGEVRKPLLATETCWGALDDAKRCEVMAIELGALAERGIGFLAHLLHHTLVADGHRPEFGPITPAQYMAFIERDGTLRKGHDIFNSF